MPPKPIINNNNPLVALCGLERLSLSRELYAEVRLRRYAFRTTEPKRTDTRIRRTRPVPV